jgi:hypothetical protein
MIAGVEYLERAKWQMTFGERSALEGLLSQLRPALSVEVGTAEGGSLKTVATYSDEVHSFDLVAPEIEAARLDNVTIHGGDSHRTLPNFLTAMATEGRAVDFALIDGDHTTEGVRLDAVDVLRSPSTRKCVILFHDTANDVVRAGLDRVDWDGIEGLSYLDLDFVPGYAVVDGPYKGQCWGGLGVAVRDVERVARDGRQPQHPFLPAPVALQAWQDAHNGASAPAPTAAETDALRAEAAELRHWLTAVQSSASWRITQPLRDAKQKLLGRR